MLSVLSLSTETIQFTLQLKNKFPELQNGAFEILTGILECFNFLRLFKDLSVLGI